MGKNHNDIIIFSIVVFLIIASLGVYIISMMYLYRRKQNQFIEQYNKLQLDIEKAILSAQVEIQEETFNNISKEIHDNISLSLTLAKLNLNTLDITQYDYALRKINNTIELITKSIHELNDVSKSLSSEIINNHGMIKALDLEITRIINAGLFKVDFSISGTPIYGELKKEVLIFRVIQEAFNNILKHSDATLVILNLNYSNEDLQILIEDNGRGFDMDTAKSKRKAGLTNMNNRVKLLNGTFNIESPIGTGTKIYFKIPIK